MNFIEAVKIMKSGGKVRQADWCSGQSIYIADNWFKFTIGDGRYPVDSNDVLSDNWEAVDEIGALAEKLYTAWDAVLYPKNFRVQFENLTHGQRAAWRAAAEAISK